MNQTQNGTRLALAFESLSQAEQVAALADGALDEASAQYVIDQILASDDLRAHWDELHHVGDCLRSDDIGGDPQARFMNQFCARFATEATIIATVRGTSRMRRRAWMRYGVPAASAAAAVAVVVFLALPQAEQGAGVVASSPIRAVQGSGTVTATQPVVSPAQTLAAAAPREPSATHANAEMVAANTSPVDPTQLAEYLAAHQQSSQTSLHGPGYVQAATLSVVRPEKQDNR
jgi:sigma-E factor negative regulatory protein RseA